MTAEEKKLHDEQMAAEGMAPEATEEAPVEEAAPVAEEPAA